ncbi:glycogen-binding domain-containing protein [uncultured Treponema sp.]|uniref:glycogen-binding domain-containing protein n=1 Tax=uncultured Treponema sp. TaxID=162155 RepID=UPI0025939D69|nr:glycogen-binding domain-containing protein [uncultured Treponema sp.]
MKKIIAFISTLLVLSAAVFADVSVKKRDDGKVEVTFFYGNPRATEVLLAGDFNNWQDGAEAMTKTDKGFTMTKVVPAGTIMKYKFISDGNWTADLKAPDTVDDGFGGKNGLVDVDTLVAAQGGGDSGAKKSGIKFISWTMLGTQSNFKTQGAVDKTKKGFDFDSQSVGLKSYNKLTGNALPGVPFYVEIALAEREIEDYTGEKKVTYVAKKTASNDWEIDPVDGLKQLGSDLLSSPVAYLANATDNSNSGAKGPGTNPFLGHLKFGFDTAWVKYYTGFNYAKMEVRQPVIWKTIDGNWDAGYNHVGGFASFSTGDKINNLFADSGVTLDAGFIPNKTADRKGTKYGYIGWLGASMLNGDVVVDLQSNGAYDGTLIFDDPVEHDFIVGAKAKFADLGLKVAAQALFATHQKSSADLEADGASGVADWSGYSTDIWYRNTENGLQNLAGNVQLSYEDSDKVWGAGVEYRMRGAQASLLYVRQNHDDGTFDLSNMLGVANSQRVAVNGYYNNEDIGLNIGLNASVEMPLEKIGMKDEVADGWKTELGKVSWYNDRFSGNYEPLYGIESGMEVAVTPTVAYTLDDMTFTAYGDLYYKNYKVENNPYITEKYGCSDSEFAFKRAGLTFNWKNIGDVVKALDVNYGYDDSNDKRMFNTLVGQVTLPMSMKASVAFGLRTVKSTEAGKAFEEEKNNPFAFAVGFSKQFTKLAKPTFYTQFCYNMDPYKHFGDGQDQLNLNRANVNGSHQKEVKKVDGGGCIDPVDWYDGRGAFRVGIRWDI